MFATCGSKIGSLNSAARLPSEAVRQRAPVVTTIIVGIVGPPALIADAEQWLEACRGTLSNDGREPFLRPHFPGVNRASPFRCELVFGQTWNQQIRGSELIAAIGESEDFRRIKHVVDLYIDAIEVLCSRDPQPNVILCCMPQDVIDHCTGLTKGTRQFRRPRLRAAARRGRRDVLPGQMLLFDDVEPEPKVDDVIEGHHNLRRGLKAVSMQYGIPTQLVWPTTLDVSGKAQVVGKRQVQDLATRAWNFTTALYHKAGGSPWRLEGVGDDVCFVGISFYKEVLDAKSKVANEHGTSFHGGWRWLCASREHV